MCAEVQAKVLIDDSLLYAEQCAPTLDHVILFGDYAWNRTKTDDDDDDDDVAKKLPENVKRVRNWEEAVKLLDSFYP